MIAWWVGLILYLFGIACGLAAAGLVFDLMDKRASFRVLDEHEPRRPA